MTDHAPVDQFGRVRGRQIQNVEPVIVRGEHELQVAILVEILERGRHSTSADRFSMGNPGVIEPSASQAMIGSPAAATISSFCSVAVDVRDQRDAPRRVAHDRLGIPGAGHQLALVVEGVDPGEDESVGLDVAC